MILMRWQAGSCLANPASCLALGERHCDWRESKKHGEVGEGWKGEGAAATCEMTWDASRQDQTFILALCTSS